MNIIEIGIAQMAIVKTPAIIITRSLGSCIAIILYDPTIQIGAMAHVMLPNSKNIKNNDSAGKFADTAVPVMINKMILRGSTKKNIIAKLVGGAKMFHSVNNGSPIDLGSKIITAAKDVLRENKIIILTQDIGKDYGRNVEFNTVDGSVLVKTIRTKTIII